MLELRFGLIDGKDHTLEEVSRYFNVTRERIRQIEAKALRKLRHPTRRMGIEQKLGNMGVVTASPGRCGQLGPHQCHVADVVWPGLLRD